MFNNPQSTEIDELERCLLKRLDDDITESEERDIMRRYEREIFGTALLPETECEIVKVRESLNHNSDAQIGPEYVERIEFIKATKLLSRKSQISRQEMIAKLLRLFRSNEGASLQAVDWFDFDIKLYNVQPSAWRLEVCGTRRAVNRLLLCLRNRYPP